jgi:hypothetical protein
MKSRLILARVGENLEMAAMSALREADAREPSQEEIVRRWPAAKAVHNHKSLFLDERTSNIVWPVQQK